MWKGGKEMMKAEGRGKGRDEGEGMKAEEFKEWWAKGTGMSAEARWANTTPCLRKSIPCPQNRHRPE